MDYSEVEQENVMRKILNSRRNRKIISIVLACVLVLIGIISFSVTVNALNDIRAENKELLKRIKELTDNPIVVNPVAPEISLDIIYSEIKEISELATVEYLFTDAAKFSDSNQIFGWNIPFTEKSFLLKWNGVIKAGIKLEQVTIEVDEIAKKIIVSLPKAEILSYETDNDSIEVLDEKNNIFNSITVEDKVKFDTATEEEMKERAIKNGLLEKATQNAQDILSRLLTANEAIGNNYTIEFKEIEQ